MNYLNKKTCGKENTVTTKKTLYSAKYRSELFSLNCGNSLDVLL